ncbi:MAG: hypothetical protein LBG17_02475 [Bacteroidales bacterium]|jgi:hypothetical protein|nr:hypothetical protein [Bacteroidales bacterium]
MKKFLFTVLVSAMLAGYSQIPDFSQVGSIVENNAVLYPTANDTANIESGADGTITTDYKIVTVGTKTWVWTKLNGSNISGEGWASQIMYKQSTGALTKPGNIAGRTGNNISYGSFANTPTENSVQINVFVYPTTTGAWTYRSTAFVSYDKTLPNSKDNEDATAPVFTEKPNIVDKTLTSVTIAMPATEASGNWFYYVADAANNYEEIFFDDTVSIALTDGTDYEFTIIPVDFSGNAGSAEKVAISGEVFVCNDIMKGRKLSPYTVFYAPGWNPSSNYTFTIKDDTVVNIYLGNQTSENWQSQFRVFSKRPAILIPGKKYSLITKVTASKNTTIGVKVYDTAVGDETALEIPLQNILAGETIISVHDITCPQNLTRINGILYNLSYNPADVDYKIHLQICGETIPGQSIKYVLRKGNTIVEEEIVDIPPK